MPKIPWPLLFLFAFWCLFPVALAAADRGLARLTYREGGVEVQRQGETTWNPLQIDETVAPFDSIRTLENGKAVLVYADFTILKLAPKSLLQPLPVEPGKSGIRLWFGTLFAKVKKWAGPSSTPPFSIESAKTVAAVRGTFFKFYEPLRGNNFHEIFAHGILDPTRIVTYPTTVLVGEGSVEVTDLLHPTSDLIVNPGERWLQTTSTPNQTILPCDPALLEKSWEITGPTPEFSVGPTPSVEGSPSTSAIPTTPSLPSTGVAVVEMPIPLPPTTGSAPISTASVTPSLTEGTPSIPGDSIANLIPKVEIPTRITFTQYPLVAIDSLDSPVSIAGIVPDVAKGNLEIYLNQQYLSRVSIEGGNFSFLFPPIRGLNIIRALFTIGATTVTEEIQFTTDIDPPLILVTQPVDGSLSLSRSIHLTGTVIETNLKKLEYRLNDGGIQLLPANGTQIDFPIQLAVGINTLQIFATDKCGNQSTTQLQTEVDPKIESATEPQHDIIIRF